MVALFLEDNKTNDDGDGKENGKRTNNNFSRVSRSSISMANFWPQVKKPTKLVDFCRQGSFTNLSKLSVF